MSSPLLIGCDLNDIKGNALSLMQNEELIALNQNKLGLQAYVVKKENGCYFLVKDIEELHGKKRAVAIYNPGESQASVTLKFDQLDLAGNVNVRDLFERSDLGTKSGYMRVTVPKHGTRIYNLEAEERLERTVYEAETGWLSAYQELTNNEADGTATYTESASCSGGAMVTWLGNKADNDLQWRNVYSFEGGNYTMNLQFICNENRTVKISINGGEPITATLNSGSWTTSKSKNFNISLNKGNNIVRIYSDQGWMPDIDCMKLTRVIPDATTLPTAEVSDIQVKAMQSGIIISTTVPTWVQVADMGGRVLHRSEVNGNLTLNLPQGEYIVNEKKVSVR